MHSVDTQVRKVLWNENFIPHGMRKRASLPSTKSRGRRLHQPFMEVNSIFNFHFKKSTSQAVLHKAPSHEIQSSSPLTFNGLRRFRAHCSEHQEWSLFWCLCGDPWSIWLFRDELGPGQTVPVSSLGNLYSRTCSVGTYSTSCQHEQL